MRKADFDAFVELLQTSVGRAQRAIEERNQGRLERQLQLDAEGRPEMLAWSFAVEDTTSGSTRERTIRLPLAVLRPHLTQAVNEVVLEFDAAIVEAEPPSPAPAETGPGRALATVEPRAPPAAPDDSRLGRLALLLRRGWWPVRHRLHRIKIRLTGKQPGAAEVYVDDTLLKVVSAEEQPSDDNDEKDGGNQS